MDDKNNQNQGMNLGELSTIRNILMGQQMAEYKQSFEGVNQTINEKEAETNEKLQALEKRMNERFANLEKDMNNRFDRLEALLMQNVKEINEHVANKSKNDKADLGRMLATISEQLIGE
jgi:hypothetical protein